MARTVAVIGGGYGGAAVAKALDDVADVVLVEPKDAFHHNAAALRAVVRPDWLTRIFLPYDNLLTSASRRLDPPAARPLPWRGPTPGDGPHRCRSHRRVQGKRSARRPIRHTVRPRPIRNEAR